MHVRTTDSLVYSSGLKSCKPSLSLFDGVASDRRPTERNAENANHRIPNDLAKRVSQKVARFCAKRVPSGELKSVPQTAGTQEFTENAERINLGVFAFPPVSARICVGLSRPRRFSVSRETFRGAEGTLIVPPGPRNFRSKLSDSLVDEDFRVNGDAVTGVPSRNAANSGYEVLCLRLFHLGRTGDAVLTHDYGFPRIHGRTLC
jgi:hypothetical protein